MQIKSSHWLFLRCLQVENFAQGALTISEALSSERRNKKLPHTAHLQVSYVADNKRLLHNFLNSN
jgi:hypothetical protein